MADADVRHGDGQVYRRRIRARLDDDACVAFDGNGSLISTVIPLPLMAQYPN
jgi:hypothetical protein